MIDGLQDERRFPITITITSVIFVAARICRAPTRSRHLSFFRWPAPIGGATRSNKMLQRIYGVSFPKKAMLDEYLKRLEEAKKRDHRKLGKELGLFTIAEETGGGLPLWLPKGALMRHHDREFLARTRILTYGYDLVMSPHIAGSSCGKPPAIPVFYRREHVFSRWMSITRNIRSSR